MAKRSITVRLNEDVIELIERQQGETFTQRFENLVTRCVWELPQVEKQLTSYREKVKREQRQLSKLSGEVGQYRQLMMQLDQKLGSLEKLIDASMKERSA